MFSWGIPQVQVMSDLSGTTVQFLLWAFVRALRNLVKRGVL